MAQSLLQELIKVVKLPINTDGLCSHLGRYVNQHFFSIKGFIHIIDMISWVILQSEPSYCVGIVLDQTAISDQLGYIYINKKTIDMAFLMSFKQKMLPDGDITLLVSCPTSSKIHFDDQLSELRVCTSGAHRSLSHCKIADFCTSENCSQGELNKSSVKNILKMVVISQQSHRKNIMASQLLRAKDNWQSQGIWCHSLSTWTWANLLRQQHEKMSTKKS